MVPSPADCGGTVGKKPRFRSTTLQTKHLRPIVYSALTPAMFSGVVTIAVSRVRLSTRATRPQDSRWPPCRGRRAADIHQSRPSLLARKLESLTLAFCRLNGSSSREAQAGPGTFITKCSSVDIEIVWACPSRGAAFARESDRYALVPQGQRLAVESSTLPFPSR